ncbi:hypothetical protein [Faecalibacter rhinopitheci]|uniref:Uncharacterized protein n=1 Tax=Faecalibacter rhinopitheci TaxID=2779678 RepID=A0A8J7KAB9_9FLAO|nr:hypothetical protein [Faecalibacter rhinopitheci]MBF0597325.1 hypothetical protein [Faecalibacter rhinopitheci]
MKQKLLELLTAKYLGKGTHKDTLARLAAAYSLQCTTEEEAQALVNKLTDEQVTDFEKEYRSEVDSKLFDSIIKVNLQQNKTERSEQLIDSIKKESDKETNGIQFGTYLTCFGVLCFILALIWLWFYLKK